MRLRFEAMWLKLSANLEGIRVYCHVKTVVPLLPQMEKAKIRRSAENNGETETVQTEAETRRSVCFAGLESRVAKTINSSFCQLEMAAVSAFAGLL